MSRDANYPSLADKNVFITGGATGIGASLVTHFVAQGARVRFIDIDDTAAHELVASLSGRATYAHCDVRDIAALQEAIASFEGPAGHIDVLVNNAARDDRHAADEVDVAYWEDRMQINFRPHFFAAQAVRGGMARAGGGSIINFGSIVVQMAAANMAAYVAAKAGIYGLTRALARDFGKDLIRVNCLIPGWVITERQRTLYWNENSAKNIAEKQCIPEPLEPADLARMALFLAADDSRRCTAQKFIVDGGWE